MVSKTSRPPTSAGDEYGGWKVLEIIEPGSQGVALCECRCGTEKPVRVNNLRRGKSTDCGCSRNNRTSQRNHRHGGSRRGHRDRLYGVWSTMNARCTNTQVRAFKHYGGRGIRVCEAWSDYVAFREWATASGYADGLTIERGDVNGNYEPDNCRWIPRAEQPRNRRDTKMLTAFGETKGLADWADDPRCRVKQGTLRSRIYRDGWDHERAISTLPV